MPVSQSDAVVHSSSVALLRVVVGAGELTLRDLWSCSRSVITAPPKPSAQTQLLDVMYDAQETTYGKLDRLMESVDMLFARMGDLHHLQ